MTPAEQKKRALNAVKRLGTNVFSRRGTEPGMHLSDNAPLNHGIIICMNADDKTVMWQHQEMVTAADLLRDPATAIRGALEVLATKTSKPLDINGLMFGVGV